MVGGRETDAENGHEPVRRPGSASAPTNDPDLLEVRVRRRFASDARIVIGSPPRGYAGRNQFRALLRRFLPAVTGRQTRMQPALRLMGKGFIQAMPAFAALLGTLFLLVPRLKPADPVPPPPPPSVLGATVSNVALEERVRPPDHPAYVVISYDVEFVGYQGKRSLVSWTGFDAVTLERVAMETPPNWGNPSQVVAEAPNDRASMQIRVLLPLEAQCVFVRVFVYDEDNTRLDYADTPPFHTHDAANFACAGPQRTPVPAA